MNFDHKILSLTTLTNIKKETGKRIVLAGGCFDILHYGHVSFMQQAREAGDILVLLLESDEYIETAKKKHPVHTQIQRAQILAALGYVDYVVQLPLLASPDADYKRITKEIGPEVIAFTANDPKAEQKQRMAQEVHASVIVIPNLSSFSSSSLITYAPIFRD